MIENPLQNKLRDHHILLASASPRRQEYLKAMGVPYQVIQNRVEESYPEHLKGAQISDYLALLKANALKESLQNGDILITADTVVWHKGISLAKPDSEADAARMLETLSGKWHDVITSVCFTSLKEQRVVSCTTEVKFSALEPEEIQYYTQHFTPFDKAGAYGIQEWLGMVGIEEIRGSYPNVVGLPTHIVYKTLMAMAG